MKIEVSLSPRLYTCRTITVRHVTVAIDVLRATTAVCAAFQAGCSEVVPLDSLESLQQYRSQGYRIAAERGGRKLEGSDYGNSPTEYISSDMTGVRMAYSTTNGTVCILKGADADITLVGAFVNLTALCERLASEDRDIVLLCSGWQGDFSLEDTLLAGAVVDRMRHLDTSLTVVGDAATASAALWRLAADAPYDYCRQATHVHRLEGFGAHADILFAFRQDTCPVVPTLKNGVLTL